MIVECEGKEYAYDPRLIEVRVAKKINEYTGLGLRSWEKGVDDCNAKCLAALLFAIKVQAGEPCHSIAALNFSALDFYDAIVQAAAKELAEKIEPEEVAETDPMVTA